MREAAGILGVTPGRVRALVTSGYLPASKISDRWLLEHGAVVRRQHEDPARGRPFTPRNAWALLMLASGEFSGELNPSVRSRLKRALRQEGLERLRPRLGGRARALPYRTHPGEAPYLLEDPLLVRSGISAAAEQGLGLVSGREADGYIAANDLEMFVKNHALAPAVQAEANVRLRVVPDEAWPLLVSRIVAPKAAVALDLSEDPDARSAQAGRQVLRELDQTWKE